MQGVAQSNAILDSAPRRLPCAQVVQELMLPYAHAVEVQLCHLSMREISQLNKTAATSMLEALNLCPGRAGSGAAGKVLIRDLRLLLWQYSSQNLGCRVPPKAGEVLPMAEVVVPLAMAEVVVHSSSSAPAHGQGSVGAEGQGDGGVGNGDVLLTGHNGNGDGGGGGHADQLVVGVDGDADGVGNGGGPGDSGGNEHDLERSKDMDKGKHEHKEKLVEDDCVDEGVEHKDELVDDELDEDVHEFYMSVGETPWPVLLLSTGQLDSVLYSAQLASQGSCAPVVPLPFRHATMCNRSITWSKFIISLQCSQSQSHHTSLGLR